MEWTTLRTRQRNGETPARKKESIETTNDIIHIVKRPNTRTFKWSLHCNLQPLTVNGVESVLYIVCQCTGDRICSFHYIDWKIIPYANHTHTHTPRTTNLWAFRYDSHRFSTSWLRLNRLSRYDGRHLSPDAHRLLAKPWCGCIMVNHSLARHWGNSHGISTDCHAWTLHKLVHRRFHAKTGMPDADIKIEIKSANKQTLYRMLYFPTFCPWLVVDRSHHVVCVSSRLSCHRS